MNVRRSPLEALLDNVNVEAMVEIPSPEEVQERLPLTDTAAETILNGRNAIRAILERKDPRLFVVVGPCSRTKATRTGTRGAGAKPGPARSRQ